MLSAFRVFFGRLNLTLLGLVILGATYWFTDQITNRQPVAPRIDRAAVMAQRQARPPRAPVFVYIIDSLRYETAIDPAIMPHLSALLSEGAYAEMMPGFNSGSAASLRDAFTGRENAAVLAAVATFIHTDAGVESIFHQMALEGLTTAAYSAGFFHQFGAGVTREVEVGLRSSHPEQEAHMFAALAALRSGEFDCVFGHLLYTDAITHEEGVGTSRYNDAFRQADALIPKLRAQLPPEATFVVMGDHGHDAKGRHGIGLNVPTLGVYVGPRFRQGIDLGATSVMSHRYLLSQALGLPLTTAAYNGDILPAALNLKTVSLPELVAGVAAIRSGGGSWPIWIYLSFLATLWFNLVCRASSPLSFSHGRALSLWVGITPLLLHGSWQQVSAGAVAVFLLLMLAWRVPTPRLLRWVVLPAVLGLLFQVWGRALTVARPWLDQLPLGALLCYWLIVAAAGALLATRQRRPWIIAVVFAVPAFLFHPVYHTYGFPGTFAPLLACWFLFYAVTVARDGGFIAGLDRRRLLGIAAALFLMLQPLASTATVAGAFDHWRSLVPGWDVADWKYLIIPAVLAKILLFFPRRPAWPALLLGVGLIVLVQLMESRFWGPDFSVRRLLGILLLAGWAAGTWWRRPEARLCGLAFLFLLYFSFVALTPRNFVETILMIGALILCAQCVVWFPQKENLSTDRLVLTLFGLMIAGWASMRWSGTHLEWHAIYEWASSSTVEKHVGWFVPWIAMKGLVPWVIILWALRERLGQLVPLPAYTLMALFCAKILTLLMTTIGMGGRDTYNRNYLETACVVAVLIMLYLGVIFLPKVWPQPAAAKTP